MESCQTRSLCDHCTGGQEGDSAEFFLTPVPVKSASAAVAWHLALEHSLCHTPGHQETVWPWHAWLQPRHHRYTTAMASEMLLVDLKRDYRIGHLDNACPISYSNWASNPLHLYIKYNTTQPDEHPNKYHTPYHNHKVIRDNGLNNQLIQLNSFATIKSVDEREQTQWAENAAVAPPSHSQVWLFFILSSTHSVTWI